MSNQQPPPFFPFPVMMPQQGYQSQVNVPMLGNEAPARVRVAVDFLLNLSYKTMPRAAANDISIEVIPGQDLTASELRTQDAACEMLYDYFGGKMKGSDWERKFLDRSRPQELDGPAGSLVDCSRCNGRTGNTECGICHGHGCVKVIPFSNQ